MKNSKSYRLISFLLICVILCISLTGCENTEPVVSDNSSAIVDHIKEIKNQLNYESSYRISFEFINFLYNGFSQEIEQTSAKDESFRFLYNRSEKNYSSSEDYHEKREYYYRRENAFHYCYLKIDDGEVQRMKVSSDAWYAMSTDRLKLIGANTLLPDYLEDFAEKVAGEEYTFRLPLNKVMEEETYLNTFLSLAYIFGGKEHNDSLNLYITCTVYVEKDSYRPTRISYDFTEVKPYVFGNGVLSAEYALQDDFMTMDIEFDFNLQESITIPDEFLNAAK